MHYINQNLLSKTVVHVLMCMQSSNNQAVGIAQNHCSGNSITSNTATSNGEEGISADNQSQGGQMRAQTLFSKIVAKVLIADVLAHHFQSSLL